MKFQNRNTDCSRWANLSQQNPQALSLQDLTHYHTANTLQFTPSSMWFGSRGTETINFPSAAMEEIYFLYVFFVGASACPVDKQRMFFIPQFCICKTGIKLPHSTISMRRAKKELLHVSMMLCNIRRHVHKIECRHSLHLPKLSAAYFSISSLNKI